MGGHVVWALVPYPGCGEAWNLCLGRPGDICHIMKLGRRQKPSRSHWSMISERKTGARPVVLEIYKDSRATGQLDWGSSFLRLLMGYVQEARENHVKKKVEEGKNVFSSLKTLTLPPLLAFTNSDFSFLWMLSVIIPCQIYNFESFDWKSWFRLVLLLSRA